MVLRHRGVVVLLAHCFLRNQPRVARQILLGVEQIRLGLRETCLGLCELRFEWPLIDDVQHVSLLDSRAVGKGLTLEEPGHLAADLDGVRRLRLRDVLVVDGHRRGSKLDDGDLRRGSVLRLRVAFAAAQEANAEREPQSGDESEAVCAFHGRADPYLTTVRSGFPFSTI